MSTAGRPLAWQFLRKLGLAVVSALVVCAAIVSGVAVAPEVSARSSRAELPPVALGSLPPEAQATYQHIFQGGPFRHAKDGVIFGNRERLLPTAKRGFYREYTVETPGARDRGARRIVCGGTVEIRPETCFYTDDHYASFRHIVP